MTLIEAIKTERPYKRGNMGWMKSERPCWYIRHPSNGQPITLTEEDILATDWQIDIKSEKYHLWMSDFQEWEKYQRGLDQ